MQTKTNLRSALHMTRNPNLNTTGTVYKFLKQRELDKRANDALREWAMSREEAFDMVMG